MRTVGRMTILSPDEVPAYLEKLLREPIPPGVLEQRRKVSTAIDRLREEILAESGPIKEDIKDLLRRERGEDPVG